jgi:predicted phage terminase large subunit-like protein
MTSLKELSVKMMDILDRLKPENIDKFCEYYFGEDGIMGVCHKEWFSKYIMDETIDRLLLEAPMGHAKSTYVGVFYPIWLLMNNPRLNIILSSNSLERSTGLIRAIRHNFEENERLIDDYALIHHHSPMPYDPQKWTEKALYLHGAVMDGPPSLCATATNAAIAGKRCHVFIGDDLIDNKNSATAELRVATKRWFDTMALSRIVPGGRCILIGTEYGPFTLYQDIINRRAGQYASWHTVVYRALSDENIGPRKELWPEYFTYDELMKRKEGALAWELCYQNNPNAVNEFRMFKEEFLKFYNIVPPDLQLFQGVDLAISLKEGANFTAIATIGIDKEQNIYVLDVWRGHINFDQSIDKIQEMYNRFNPMCVGIEGNSYQQALPEHLMKITAIPIKIIKQTQSKEYRLAKLSKRFENGKIHLPRNKLSEFVEEYLTYDPTDKTKSPDQLDALDLSLCCALENMNRKVVTTIAGESWKKSKWGL